MDLSGGDEDDEEDGLLDRDDGEEFGEEEGAVEPSDRLSIRYQKDRYRRRLRCCPNSRYYQIRRTRWGRLRCYVRRSYRWWNTTGRCGGSRTAAKATANINLGGTRYTVTLQKLSRNGKAPGSLVPWWQRSRYGRWRRRTFGRRVRRGWLKNTRRRSRKTWRRSRKVKRSKRRRSKKQAKRG